MRTKKNIEDNYVFLGIIELGDRIMEEQRPIIVSDLDEVARIHSNPKYSLWKISFNNGCYTFSPPSNNLILTKDTSSRFHIDKMPPSDDQSVREAKDKLISCLPLTVAEKIIVGRDNVVTKLGDNELKPDHVYRTVSERMLQVYINNGFVIGTSDSDEYVEYEQDGKIYNNNKGVDWYLGGVAFKYGNIILECPADKRFFVPAYDYGTRLAAHGRVRHMKSSGYANPVPMDMINVLYYNKDKNQIEKFEISNKRTPNL